MTETASVGASTLGQTFSDITLLNNFEINEASRLTQVALCATATIPFCGLQAYFDSIPLTAIGTINQNCTMVTVDPDDSVTALTIFFDTQIRAVLLQT